MSFVVWRSFLFSCTSNFSFVHPFPSFPRLAHAVNLGEEDVEDERW